MSIEVHGISLEDYGLVILGGSVSISGLTLFEQRILILFSGLSKDCYIMFHGTEATGSAGFYKDEGKVYWKDYYTNKPK